MVVVTHEPFQDVEKESMHATPCVVDYEQNPAIIGQNSYNFRQAVSPQYTIPLDIRDVKTALDFLRVAISTRDRVLLQKCIESLDNQLNPQNVLTIYSSLGDCEKSRTENFRPSAPPFSEQDQRDSTEWIPKLLGDIRHNCLLEIDKNADYILQNKDILNLSYPDILNILQRDTLQVSCEAIVYKTVFNWTIAECQRRSQNFANLSPRDKKEVLQNLAFAPRYGLMTKSEFMSRNIQALDGPRYSGILDETEWRYIKFYLKEKSKGRPVNPLNHKMSSPRIIGNIKPVDLSSRSRNIRKNEISFEKRASDSSQCSRKTFFEKCLINLFTCWSFIFD
ncbi:uncharacterized protein LOC108742135 isoform X2 [Agrilus planipennis]|nr:uncharacterized protein LOC108742135 isoform X2 [Agrilus planipennis]XP_018332696.1 uncharacterized protein LOC108742135 isoform X2 [Agrilus planipennis]XP_018332697.1 uncharacterized protein LOC108742135 isoform X2 [Agrilus planipennis]XP_018332698.1 uncharacterized protein LOC108742135 isoform X2 [Agrilus planipennis]